MFTSPRAKRRTVAILAVLLAVLAGLTLAFRRYVPALGDPVAVRETVRGFGVFAPLAFVGLQAAQVVVAPIPGQVLGFASGYLFGTLPGTAYSLLGAAIGSYVAFWLSRRYGRAYVERAITPETLAEFDAVSADRGLVALFLVFLLPGLPDDVVCFVAGLSDLSIRKMVAVSVLGRLPGYLVVNAAGAGLASQDLLQTGALVALMLALSGVGYYYRGRLLAWVERRPAGE